jgi:hypothetical protein
MRRALLKGAAGMIGGLGPRRADQRVAGTSRAGVGPAPAGGLIVAQRVVVFGTGANRGIFVYSPTPAAGNLVASITAAAGTDPYGNAYKAGITSYDNTFGGITELNGALFSLFSGVNLKIVLNAAGAFFYSPAGGAGNLIASIAPASGTDSFGNAYVQGSAGYVTIAGNRYVTTIGHTTLGSFAGGLVIQNQTSPANQPASVSAIPAATGSQMQIASGTGTALSQPAVVNLIDSLNSGFAGGQIQLGVPGGGVGQVVSVNADGNTYRVERLSVRLAANQLVNSAAMANVITIANAAAGQQYRIEGEIVFTTAAAAGAAALQFASTGTITDMSVSYRNWSVGGSSNTNANRFTALTTALNSNTFAAGIGQFIELRGWVTFATAGNFGVQMACTIAADTYTVQKDSFLDLMPVS